MDGHQYGRFDSIYAGSFFDKSINLVSDKHANALFSGLISQVNRLTVSLFEPISFLDYIDNLSTPISIMQNGMLLTSEGLEGHTESAPTLPLVHELYPRS